MPAPVKATENMSKHLTDAEQQARQAAEDALLPKRDKINLKPPAYINKDKDARRYWTLTLKRLKGVELLDDLDTEMLAVYCSQLSRRDQLNSDYQAILADKELKPNERFEASESILGKLAALERNILAYAEKLGLTPSGRQRLVRQRAAAMSEAPDPLFGD